MVDTQPRANRDATVVAGKLARVNDPHVLPLNDLVRRIRNLGKHVPWFDPDSGGIYARALFLFEAPGARATGRSGPRANARGSGFISVDNNDRTAENSWRLYQETGLPREYALHWNAVPWYVGDAAKIRAATGGDLQKATPFLAELLRLLPDLRIIVACGRAAQDAWARFQLTEDAPVLPWLAVPHCSPRVFNINPNARDLVAAAMRKVKAVVEQDGSR